MAETDPTRRPRFYFALLRLLLKLAGGCGGRTEQNRWEANTVGLAVFAITYLALASLLPEVHSWWSRVPLFVALMLATWLFWALVVFLNSLVIRLLRRIGLMRDLPNNRAQSVLIGILTTAFAGRLVHSGSWLGVIGLVWIGALCCNLLAAALLALTHADRATTR